MFGRAGEAKLSITGLCRSGDADFVGDNPQLNLAEALVEKLLIADKELGIFLSVLQIHDQAHITFIKPLAFVDPNPAEMFRMEGNAESGTQVLEHTIYLLGLHQGTVVIPGGQDYLVASE
jgi:hypothetical protein